MTAHFRKDQFGRIYSGLVRMNSVEVFRFKVPRACKGRLSLALTHHFYTVV